MKTLPTILSHHDVILSSFCLAALTTSKVEIELVKAPRVNIQRERVEWTEEGIAEYESIVTPELQRLREVWLDPA